MSGFVYFLRGKQSQMVKIGYAIAPKDRLRTYIAWSPEPLELVCTIPGSLKLERNIQNCFADQHSHHEWFHAGGRLSVFLNKMAIGVPFEAAIDLTDIRGNVLGNIQRATMAANGTKPGWTRPARATRQGEAAA